MQTPNVLNELRTGNAVFKIYAYRKLSKEECMQAVGMYMRSKHLKKMPKSGTHTIYTIIGAAQ